MHGARSRSCCAGMSGARLERLAPAGAGRGPAADLPADARRGPRPPGRRPRDVHRLRRRQSSWSRCSPRCWRWTAASAPATRSTPRGGSPASSTGRSCTARARSRRCGASPTSTSVDLAESFAYSDSASDLPMLRAVGNAVVVNPDEELRAVARERGLAGDALREARPPAGCASPAPPRRVAVGGIGGRRLAAPVPIGSRPAWTSELAFAGSARLAELLRCRRGLLARADRALPRADRAPRPEAERLLPRCFAERALAQADEADRRIGGGRGGADAGRADRDQGRRGHRGRADHARHRRPSTGPRADDSPMVARLRDAGAVFLGKTNLPELAICGFTESKTWGMTRNPWDTDRTPSGSSGGSAAAVAAGPLRGGVGLRRRRLDPQPGRLLQPVRPQAPAGPDPVRSPPTTGAGCRSSACVTQTVLDTALWLDVTMAAGGEPGAPPPPERPYVEAAASAPGKLRVALSTKPVRAVAPPIVTDEVKRGVADAGELLRSLGHEVSEQDPPTGSPATTSPPATSAASTTTSRRSRTPSASRRARAASAGWARSTRRPRSLGGRGPAAKDAARINALFDDFDVLITPVVGEVAFPVGRWEGKGALRTLLGHEPQLLLRARSGTTPASPPRPSRSASPTTACRARSSSSPRRTARTCCSRSPPRSRPSGPGRTAARRSPEACARAAPAPRLRGMADRARGAAPRPPVARGGLLASSPSARRCSRRSPASRSQPALHRGGPRRVGRRARPRLPRRVPLHPRRLSVDVPRAPVDDAPVRRLRHRRGDQRALPLPARPRPDRALDRVRHADPDGARLRPRPLARRGRASRASRSTPSTTWRRSSTASRSTRSPSR